MQAVKAEKAGQMHEVRYNVAKCPRKPGENVTKYKVALAGEVAASHHLVAFPDFCAQPCPPDKDPLVHGEKQNELRAEYFAWMEERALYEALHAAGFKAEAPATPAWMLPPASDAPPAEEPPAEEPPAEEPPAEDAQEGDEQ